MSKALVNPRLALCACLLVLPLLWGQPAAAEQQNTILSGKVITTVTRMPVLPFDAVIEEVLVNPGDRVKTGTPLLRYSLRPEAARALQKELAIGANTEELKSQALTLQSELANANAERNKARQLAASGLGSQAAASRLDGNAASLQQRIALTRESVQKAEDNFALRLKELSFYFGQEVQRGQALPEMLVLTSPIDGHVLTVASNAKTGALMPAGSAPVSVGDLDPMLIQVQVYEAEISRISVGDNADVEIPSLEGKVFSAKVTQIAWASNDMNVSQPSFYAVDLSVPNPDMELKPGFKAIVHFGKGK